MQFWTKFIIGVFASKLIVLLFPQGWSDMALFPCAPDTAPEYLQCPDYFKALPEHNPEGMLWFLINPIWLGNYWYTAYVLLFDALATLAYSRMKKIPIQYLANLQLLSTFIYFGFGHVTQNVTILMSMPLMFYSVWFGALSIMQKIPIDWYILSGFNWNEPHVVCARLCGSNGVFEIFDFLNRFSGWLVLVIGFLMTIWWARKVYKRGVQEMSGSEDQ